ncbi:hypothetical protein OT109_03935 [Phycisphaeraceae bacterium D3-23]
MSVQRDRFTFFAVLVAVGVAVFGYVRLGDLYPTTGRAAVDPNPSEGHLAPAGAAEDGEEVEEEADHTGRVGR